MTKISMDLVKVLRDRTQVGMMACKNALEEAGGDMEKAVELLRKKGAAVAAKRSDNATDNGRIESHIGLNFHEGSLVEVACETDFSANTQDMKTFAQDIAHHIVSKNPDSVNGLMEQPLFNSPNPNVTVQSKLEELIAKICESIKVARFVRFQTDAKGFINTYIHPGSTVGVIIEIATDKETSGSIEKLKELTRDLCMQIAVTTPHAVKPEDLDKKLIEKEKEVITEQLKQSGKPDAMISKIMTGKLQKFYQEVCLLNQSFIKNDKLSVQQHIDAIGSELGMKISVTKFLRYSIGR